jgi:phytoene synthase
MTDRSASISTYGTSYKRWTVFFPAQLRQDTQLLYAFVREADEYVDSNQRDHTQAQLELDTMLQAFHSAHQWIPTWRKLTDEFAILCNQKSINPDRVDAFFFAMKQDTIPVSYNTYQQVQQYMYGSAEVIGLMMCQLIWYDITKQDEVFRTAKLLWEAMQFTNFLRDIQEDREELGRIYMPSDHLSTYNLSHTLMKQYLIDKKPVDTAWKEFMQSQVARMRLLYVEANTGIKHLNTSWRFGVYLASKLYEWILDVIENNHYDVFKQDCHTSKIQKFFLFTKAITTYGFSKFS